MFLGLRLHFRNKNKQNTISKNNKNDSVKKNSSAEGVVDSDIGINIEERDKVDCMSVEDTEISQEVELGKETQGEYASGDRQTSVNESNNEHGIEDQNGDNSKDNNADHNTNNANSNGIGKEGDEVSKSVAIKKSTYANTLIKIMNDKGNQLFTVPTDFNCKGEEVVLFDEDLVREGSEKWKLTDIVVDADDMCFFKFKDDEGMKYILEQSPWITRLLNVPLEAWSIKRISVISRRLGRPVMMDQVTSEMCNGGTGRLGYARVLVEVDASNKFLDKVEINFMDDKKNVKMSKWVKVEYSWKPDRCNHCNEFGHSINHCKEKPINNIKTENKRMKNVSNMDGNKEGFVEGPNSSPKTKRSWRISKENVEELKRSANKYSVLAEESNFDEGVDPFLDKRLIVDEFIKKNLQPFIMDTKHWSYDMINYFKYAWEAMERKDYEVSDEEDVYENVNQVVYNVIADVVMGSMDGSFNA
ncbi:RNA-directed DNA polymerase, eukaryota, reverse transcriptase zinc-binding domain protein [Tanacetum coccineum]